jgi:hypothetical protein
MARYSKLSSKCCQTSQCANCRTLPSVYVHPSQTAPSPMYVRLPSRSPSPSFILLPPSLPQCESIFSLQRPTVLAIFCSALSPGTGRNLPPFPPAPPPPHTHTHTTDPVSPARMTFVAFSLSRARGRGRALSHLGIKRSVDIKRARTTSNPP